VSSKQKCIKGYTSISPLTTRKILPKIYQIYETRGNHYEWQEMLLGNTKANMQKKDAKNLE
jgi:hypothetical protein